jgi:predicted HicB family RNase H-like nuclease
MAVAIGRGLLGTRRGNTEKVETTKREYDFSSAERGKFHRPEMELSPPVRLEPGVLKWLTSHAQSKGTTLNELVDALLKKDIELIEAAK